MTQAVEAPQHSSSHGQKPLNPAPTVESESSIAFGTVENSVDSKPQSPANAENTKTSSNFADNRSPVLLQQITSPEQASTEQFAVLKDSDLDGSNGQEMSQVDLTKANSIMNANHRPDQLSQAARIQGSSSNSPDMMRQVRVAQPEYGSGPYQIPPPISQQSGVHQYNDPSAQYYSNAVKGSPQQQQQLHANNSRQQQVLSRASPAYTYHSYRYYSGQSQDEPNVVGSAAQSPANAQFTTFGDHLGSPYNIDEGTTRGWAPAPPNGSLSSNGRIGGQYDDMHRRMTDEQIARSHSVGAGHQSPSQWGDHTNMQTASAPGSNNGSPWSGARQQAGLGYHRLNDGKPGSGGQSPSWQQTANMFDRVGSSAMGLQGPGPQAMAMKGSISGSSGQLAPALPDSPAPSLKRTAAEADLGDSIDPVDESNDGDDHGESSSQQAPRKRASKGKARERNNEKRFTCPHEECGRSFARNYNLQAHLKSHMGIRDFKCPECSKSFSRKHDCTRHCVAVHSYSKETGKAKVEEVNANVSTKYVTLGIRRPEENEQNERPEQAEEEGVSDGSPPAQH